MSGPFVSIVINTYNRAESLRVTLEALRQLDYETFEVVVVNGPSTDGTEDVLTEYASRIKADRCAHRNLSESRNIGIALAAGEIVAFIDDDAYPDPAWLDRIVAGYDSEEVAAVGGPVYDHTGAAFQARYSIANRYGVARVDTDVNPTELLGSPDSGEFTYLIGTNSSFRRDRLVVVGGFDEEFEYYLDETDVCRRLMDRGWLVRALDDGFMYHKFLASDVRTGRRAIRDRYSVLKNTAYFALKHGVAWGSFAEACQQLATYVAAQRADVRWSIDQGTLTDADLAQFELDVNAGFNVAFARHLRGERGERPPAWFGEPPPFLPFPAVRPRETRLNLCFITREWPPQQLNGIARVVHTLATGLARAGHVVHVLTRGEDHDRVDLEAGVWVHRIVVRPHELPATIEAPQRIWDHTASMLDELRRIESTRPVDIVQIPNWDAEGAAVLLAGGFTTVLGLYTPLATVREVDPRMAGPSEELDHLVAMERHAYRHAGWLLACGQRIVDEIESRYGITLAPERIGLVPHGIPEASTNAPPQTIRPRGGVDVLFVGRLEPRKGIDTLLACIPSLGREFPELRFVIAGNDTLLSDSGRPYRVDFQRSAGGIVLGDRVVFTGAVDDDELERLYAACDVFVAPSRYESFGLILIEAMRVRKPVVACQVGGMREIVEDGVSGLLVDAGDVEGLRTALARLVASPALRARMGARGRELYEERYTAERMVDGVNRFYDRILGRSTAGATSRGDGPDVSSPAGHGGLQATGTPAFHQPAAETAPRQPPMPVAPPQGPVRVRAGARLLDCLACPQCRSPLREAPSVVTADGRIKSGLLLCDACSDTAGVVEQFKMDFHLGAGAPPPVGPPRIVPVLGERRVRADDPSVQLRGSWVRDGEHGVMRSPGSRGDAAELRAEFTDVIVRLVADRGCGMVDMLVDGRPVEAVDLHRPEGRLVLGVVAASDLPFEEHVVSVRARGPGGAGARGAQVIVEEFVLLGPLDARFGPPNAINRGNPYGPVLEKHIGEMPPDELILEIGGGDRRRGDPRHVNFEYLRFELADMYGDIHCLPFGDDAFGLVVSQAVFEHVANPFHAAEELIRVTRPGGIIVTEAAFMQPLHGVPNHFFNMTPWGAQELFKSCDLLQCDWSGQLSTTVDWLMRSVSLEGKVSDERLRRIVQSVAELDPLVTHDDLRAAASGVHIVVRKPG